MSKILIVEEVENWNSPMGELQRLRSNLAISSKAEEAQNLWPKILLLDTKPRNHLTCAQEEMYKDIHWDFVWSKNLEAVSKVVTEDMNYYI